MVSGGDAQTSPVVVDDGPDEGGRAERRPERSDAANQGNSQNENDIEPIDVLVPVLAGHRCLGDVHLFGVVLDIADGVVGGSISGGHGSRQLGGVDGEIARGRLRGRHCW